MLDWKKDCLFYNKPYFVTLPDENDLFMIHFVDRDDKDNRKTEYAKLTKCDGIDNN
jgi:hypothetical protein